MDFNIQDLARESVAFVREIYEDEGWLDPLKQKVAETVFPQNINVSSIEIDKAGVVSVRV
jgi:hypothetical protein